MWYTDCMAVSKQFSIRMPVDIARKLEERGKVTPFIISAVREKLERERQQEIREQLKCLAHDAEANDISDIAPAQKRVIARGD
jgi:hypothetical protein